MTEPNPFREVEPCIFSADVKVAATVYIKASTADEARRKFLETFADMTALYSDGNLFSDRRFDDPKLPEVSLSPSMTVLGLYEEV